MPATVATARHNAAIKRAKSRTRSVVDVADEDLCGHAYPQRYSRSTCSQCLGIETTRIPLRGSDVRVAMPVHVNASRLSRKGHHRS